jgi:hypothetical protein
MWIRNANRIIGHRNSHALAFFGFALSSERCTHRTRTSHNQEPWPQPIVTTYAKAKAKRELISRSARGPQRADRGDRKRPDSGGGRGASERDPRGAPRRGAAARATSTHTDSNRIENTLISEAQRAPTAFADRIRSSGVPDAKIIRQAQACLRLSLRPRQQGRVYGAGGVPTRAT